MRKYFVIHYLPKKTECITILWWVLILLFVHLTSRLASTFSCTFYCVFTLPSCKIYFILFVAKIWNNSNHISYFIFLNKIIQFYMAFKPCLKIFIKKKSSKLWLFFIIWIQMYTPIWWNDTNDITCRLC